MKIKLLYVLWEGIGGVERIVLDLTRRLDSEKYDITVAILQRGGCVTDLIDRENISVVEFGARSGKDIKAFRAFRSFLLSEKFDIVHCNERSFLINLALAVSRPRPVLVYHEHGGHLFRGNLKTRLTYLTFARFYNVYIALHNEMVRYMVQASKVCRNKIVIIENAVDIDYFKPSNDAQINSLNVNGVWTIGTVARLSPEKDFNLFFETVRSILRKQGNVKFVVVGDGVLKSELQREAQSADVQGKVDFIGAKGDIPSVLRTFDLFLTTSRVETFPMTVLESLACGVPVVAVKLEIGVSTRIFESFPGVSIVQERNAHALADKCLTLLESPKKLELMKQAGREYVVQNNDLNNYVRNIDKLYERLLKDRN